MKKNPIAIFLRGFCAAFPFISFLYLGTVQACDENCERFLQQQASDARLGRQIEKERIEAMRQYEQHHQNSDELNRLRAEQMKKMAMRDKIIESNGQYKSPDRDGDAALAMREQAATQVAERNKILEKREAKYRSDLKEWQMKQGQSPNR